MRRAFTLIELIFVIVIIGLLAAIAVPKFINLKEHADINSIVKTTVDAAEQAASVAADKYNLDNNNTFRITDLVSLTGNGWQCDNGRNWCYYKDPVTTNTIAQIKLDTTKHIITYDIYCYRIKEDPAEEKLCEEIINNNKINYLSQLEVNLSY